MAGWMMDGNSIQSFPISAVKHTQMELYCCRIIWLPTNRMQMYWITASVWYREKPTSNQRRKMSWLSNLMNGAFPPIHVRCELLGNPGNLKDPVSPTSRNTSSYRSRRAHISCWVWLSWLLLSLLPPPSFLLAPSLHPSTLLALSMPPSIPLASSVS